MKKWMNVKQNKAMIPLDDFQQMLRDLDTNEIAIKAINTSPFSYGLLAKVRPCKRTRICRYDVTLILMHFITFLQILGYTVIYFIVCIQP